MVKCCEEKLVPLRALANLAWALSVGSALSSQVRRILQSLQHELVQRCSEACTFDEPAMFRRFSSDALEILWASNLAEAALPTLQLEAVWGTLVQCAAACTRTTAPLKPLLAPPSVSPLSSIPLALPPLAPTASAQEPKEPRIIYQLSDRILEPILQPTV